MRKSDIVERVAAEAMVTRLAGEIVVNTVFASIGGALARGEDVTVAGFGKVSTRDRGVRMGRNPRTREPVAIGPSRTVSFKAAKALTEAVK